MTEQTRTEAEAFRVSPEQSLSEQGSVSHSYGFVPMGAVCVRTHSIHPTFLFSQYTEVGMKMKRTAVWQSFAKHVDQ